MDVISRQKALEALTVTEEMSTADLLWLLTTRINDLPSADAPWISKKNYGHVYTELKKKVSINSRVYFVFVHDFGNKWDCVGQFKTYAEAVKCSEEYRKYGEVKILTERLSTVKEK